MPHTTMPGAVVWVAELQQSFMSSDACSVCAQQRKEQQQQEHQHQHQQQQKQQQRQQQRQPCLYVRSRVSPFGLYKVGKTKAYYP